MASDSVIAPRRHHLPRVIGVSFLLMAVLFGLFLLYTNPPSSLPPSGTGEEVLGPSRSLDIQFDKPSVLSEWHEHVFNKKSRYAIEPDGAGGAALHASSRDAYSALYKIINVPISSRPVLSWEWRAMRFPGGKKYKGLGTPGEDDFAIRVCAIFAKNNPFDTKILQYVWDDHYPIGTHDKSPYAGNVRIFVVRTGIPKTPGWTLETRDLAKDYELAFGGPPSGNLRAISIISNSDDTHTGSEAYLRRLWVDRTVVPPAAKRWWRLDLGQRTKRLEIRVKGLLGHLNIRKFSALAEEHLPLRVKQW